MHGNRKEIPHSKIKDEKPHHCGRLCFDLVSILRSPILLIKDCQKIRKNLTNSKIQFWWMTVCQKLNEIKIHCRRMSKCVQK